METIDQQRFKWIEAISSGNLEAFSELLTEDAVWLPPGQVAVAGRPAIRAWLAPLFVQFNYDFSITNVQVRLVGEWAVEKAHFTSQLTHKHSGEAMQHESCYIVLWRQEEGGIWRIERYIDDAA
jgi:uncharacterized protein (TIGR02246 family)